MPRPKHFHRDRLPADYLQPLVTALANPATLAGIRRDELQPVAFQLALYYGMRREADTAAALGGVYERMVEEVTAEERGTFVDELAAAVRGEASTVLALLPVLQRERDAGVARAAALAFAGLMPASSGDALAGPRALRALLVHADLDGVRAGLVGALLALGDRRVRPLLDGTWRVLAPDAAAALLALPRTWASELELGWLLDWLEDAEPATFAAVAGSLARLARAGGGRVLDLEQALPGPVAAGAAVTVLHDRGVAEVGERLAARLRDLERRAGPGALREVFAAWGVPQ